jgi:hypothetical protein
MLYEFVHSDVIFGITVISEFVLWITPPSRVFIEIGF